MSLNWWENIILDIETTVTEDDELVFVSQLGTDYVPFMWFLMTDDFNNNPGAMPPTIQVSATSSLGNEYTFEIVDNDDGTFTANPVGFDINELAEGETVNINFSFGACYYYYVDGQRFIGENYREAEITIIGQNEFPMVMAECLEVCETDASVISNIHICDDDQENNFFEHEDVLINGEQVWDGSTFTTTLSLDSTLNQPLVDGGGNALNVTIEIVSFDGSDIEWKITEESLAEIAPFLDQGESAFANFSLAVTDSFGATTEILLCLKINGKGGNGQPEVVHACFREDEANDSSIAPNDSISTDNFVFDLNDFVSDPENEALTFEMVNTPNGFMTTNVGGVEYQIVIEISENGLVTIVDGQEELLALNDGEIATFSFEYTVSDGTNDPVLGTGEIKIYGTNDDEPPVVDMVCFVDDEDAITDATDDDLNDSIVDDADPNILQFNIASQVASQNPDVIASADIIEYSFPETITATRADGTVIEIRITETSEGIIRIDNPDVLDQLAEGEIIDFNFEYTITGFNNVTSLDMVSGSGPTTTEEAFSISAQGKIQILGTSDSEPPVALSAEYFEDEDGLETNEELLTDIDANDDVTPDIEGDLTFELPVTEGTSSNLTYTVPATVEVGGITYTVTNNEDGTVSLDTAEFQYLEREDEVTLEIPFAVMDEFGNVSDSMITVTIFGRDINAEDDNDLVATQGEDTLLDVLSNDTDLDGDDVTEVLSIDSLFVNNEPIDDANILDYLSIINGEVYLRADAPIPTIPNGESIFIKFGYTSTDDRTDGVDETDDASVTLRLFGTYIPPQSNDGLVDDEDALDGNVLAGDLDDGTYNDNGTEDQTDDTITFNLNDGIEQGSSTATLTFTPIDEIEIANVIDPDNPGVNIPVTGSVSADGTLTITNPEVLDFMNVGEAFIKNLEVTVYDGVQNTNLIIPVTILGTNDNPEDENENEILDPVNMQQPTDSLLLNATDIDDVDSDLIISDYTYTVTGPDGVDTSGVSVVVNTSTGVVHIYYDTLPPISANENFTVVIDYTVQDPQGGETDSVATYIIGGTYIPPQSNDGLVDDEDALDGNVLAGDLDDGTYNDNGTEDQTDDTITFNLNDGIDENSSPVQSFTPIAETQVATVENPDNPGVNIPVTGSVSADGTFTITNPEELDFLNIGDSIVINLDVTVFDGVQNTSLTIPVTILGTNDAPVDGNENVVLDENITETTINVLDNTDDVDNNEDTDHTVTLDPNSPITITGPDGPVTVPAEAVTLNAGGTLNVNIDDLEPLANGEQYIVTVPYIVDDNEGQPNSTVQSTATITFTNQSGVPQIGDGLSDDEDAILDADVANNVVDENDSSNDNTTVNDQTDDILTFNLLDVVSDSDSDPSDVNVTDVNITPVVVSFPDGDETITFTNNGDGTITFDDPDVFDQLQVGESVSVPVEFTVMDENGNITTGTTNIIIHGTNDAPSDANESDTTDYGVQPDVNVLDNSGNGVIDVDNDTHTAYLNPTEPVTVTGPDGPVPISTDTVTLSADGTININYDDLPEINQGEQYTITIPYIVDDGEDNNNTDTSVATIIIGGNNEPPVTESVNYQEDEDGDEEFLIANDNQTEVEGALVFAFNASDNDIGDILTYSYSNLPIVTLPDVDGTSFELSVTLTDINGNPDNTGGYFMLDTEQFQALELGDQVTFSFDYTVSDGSAVSNTSSVTVTIHGQDVVAVDNTGLEFQENSGNVLIDVLADQGEEDSDFNVTGDELHLRDDSIGEITVRDAQGNVVNVDTTGLLTIVNNQVQVNTGIIEIPNGQTWTVETTYIAYDPNEDEEDTAILSFSLTDPNLPPTDENEGDEEDGGPIIVQEDEDITINVLDNADDDDLPDDDLDFCVTGLTVGGDPILEADWGLYITFVEETGELTLITDNISIDANGDPIQVVVNYTVKDEAGEEDESTATFEVIPENDPPKINDIVFVEDEDDIINADTAEPDLNDSTVGDGTFEFNLLDPANPVVTDPEGDTLTFDEDSGTVNVTVTEGPNAGLTLAVAYTVTSAGIINLVDDTLFNQLAFADVAEFEVPFTVNDSNGNEVTDTTTIRILGVNDGPQDPDEEYEIPEGEKIIFNVLDNEQGTATDPDGDDLDICIDVLTVNGVEIFNIENGDNPAILETYLIVDEETGEVCFDSSSISIPTGGDPIQVLIDYTVKDNDGGEDTSTTTITIVPSDDPDVEIPNDSLEIELVTDDAEDIASGVPDINSDSITNMVYDETNVPTFADDVIEGNDGDDTIRGDLENFIITATAGDATAEGIAFIGEVAKAITDVSIDENIINFGDDQIDGGNGNDLIVGDAQNVLLQANQGDMSATHDVDCVDPNVYASANAKIINNNINFGDDNLVGGHGDDTIIGDTQNITIEYNNGETTIAPVGSPDAVVNDDDDAFGIASGEQNTFAFGNDTIEGGKGNDTLTGDVETITVIVDGVETVLDVNGDLSSAGIFQFGEDTFVFDASSSFGDDTITDLNAGGVNDHIQFNGVTNVADLNYTLEVVGSAVKMNIDANNNGNFESSITFEGYTDTSVIDAYLNGGDIIFG